MTIEGDYTLFAHLETVYLGVLARRTLITTNVVRVLEAANGKPIIFMPARHDHHRVQTGRRLRGLRRGPGRRRADRRHDRRAGVLVGRPRDRHRAARADRLVRRQHRARGDEVRRVGAPTTSTSPCSSTSRTTRCETALEVARALGPRLWGVRLDTSETLVDRSLWDEMGDFDPTRRQRAARAQGARRARRRRLRAREDRRLGRLHGRAGSASSRRQSVPVDAYGVGSSLIRGENDFTADIVLTDGRPSAKVGRSYRPNPRLELVT